MSTRFNPLAKPTGVCKYYNDYVYKYLGVKFIYACTSGT